MWCSQVKRIQIHVIHYKSYIFEWQQPTECRGSHHIQNSVAVEFSSLISTFFCILMLISILRLPIVDSEVTQYILNLVGDFRHFLITDEGDHFSLFTYHIPKDKLWIIIHSIYIAVLRGLRCQNYASWGATCNTTCLNIRIFVPRSVCEGFGPCIATSWT